jgi:molybdopterin molybdotransferase
MKTLQSVTSCLSDYDPDALPVALAQTIISDLAAPVAAVEKVALRAALRRVLAHDVLAPLNVPGYDNSAMDGYAFAGAALANAGLITLKVAGHALAGVAHDGPVAPGTCIRIMTGALLPAQCDTVVAQEHVETDRADDTEAALIRFSADAVKPGGNVRHAGEDLALGCVALPAGRLVMPADLGLLASLGYAEVAVRRRVRVAFFSTGDELRSIGEPLPPGCVYDSNRYTMYGMLQRLGVDAIDLGVVGDDPAALEAALRSAAECADAVITSGGVSVGDADYTRELMARLGEVAFWKVAMRPGRPFAFGRIGSSGHNPSNGAGALFFGLPGNPVAVMVSFYLFVRDALLAMSGAAPSPAPLLKARTGTALRKRPGRSEFLRGHAHCDAQGQWQVQASGAQGSGMLSSMSRANCLIVLEHDQADVEAGAAVSIMLFSGLV